MKVGVPREIKADEYRVAMIPVGVESLVKAGHEVLVEAQSGVGSGFADEDYVKAGAKMVAKPADIFAQADLIVKVKEPQEREISMFRPGQVIFTYFHLAADAG